MNKRTCTSRGLALLLSLLLVLGSFAGCGGKQESSGAGSGSQAVSAASKSITLTVVHKDGSQKDFPIQTDAQNLREALEQEKLIAGEESEYGLFVNTVDGEKADEANEEWWKLTDKDGEMSPTGVDGTEISDGDAYTFTLTVGYDS